MDATEAEATIHAALLEGDRKRAATLAVESYGREVLAFIEDRVRPSGDADEVFASVLEALWDSLERFRGDCSMRTWCYVLTRRAISRHRRGMRVQRRRELDAEIDQLSQLTQRGRSGTAPYQRTEVKSRARELRESLPDEDQQLLILRLERGLSFRDIAQVMSEDEEPSAEALTREAARLRKRFQLSKERLTELLVSEGLVEQ
jgi:RNA polymerase sigma-70 factor (ECF subfamily)